MTIYERYGRLVEDYDRECEQHRISLGMLAKLKSGEVPLERLAVADDAMSWRLTSPDKAKPPSVAPTR